ncbi:MAG: DNA topoisomerase I, partial [Candidatus Aenigmarchaeota archaeon]|nr:DNA topoisomerase I [Candidatus Aenigmarchaeota archaeon]
LAKKYDAIMKYIAGSLSDEDEKRRKVATVCYLIDALNIRVGDEKGEDEADTVGATTLTNKNVIVKQGSTVEFDFLGKDSVRMQRELELPPEVVRNLKEFVADAEKRAGRDGKAMLFEGVRSEGVRAFLDEVAPDVTAKVFRTFHSTQAVEEYLTKNPVKPDDDEDYKRYVAAMANLQAAIVCNHKRKLPKNWEESLRKKEDGLLRLEARLEETRKKAKEKAAADAEKARKELIASVKSTKETKAKKPARRDPTAKAKEALERARLRLKAIQATKDYNLNTSLKNYIDPRVYKRWADKVKFDWTKYYPKTMQKKFSWVDKS